jgi:hypothetical protein
MEDLFQDMATDDDGGGDASEEAIVRDPEGAELLEEIANHLEEDVWEPEVAGEFQRHEAGNN